MYHFIAIFLSQWSGTEPILSLRCLYWNANRSNTKADISKHSEMHMLFSLASSQALNETSQSFLHSMAPGIAFIPSFHLSSPSKNFPPQLLALSIIDSSLVLQNSCLSTCTYAGYECLISFEGSNKELGVVAQKIGIH